MSSLKCWLRRLRDLTTGACVNRDTTLKVTTPSPCCISSFPNYLFIFISVFYVTFILIFFHLLILSLAFIFSALTLTLFCICFLFSHAPPPPPPVQPYWLSSHLLIPTPHEMSQLVSTLQAGFPSSLDSWPLKMGPIHCPEMQVNNYHTLLHNAPEEHRSHQHCSGSLKLRFVVTSLTVIEHYSKTTKQIWLQHILNTSCFWKTTADWEAWGTWGVLKILVFRDMKLHRWVSSYWCSKWV
jgi:hypothetical protein